MCLIGQPGGGAFIARFQLTVPLCALYAGRRGWRLRLCRCAAGIVFLVQHVPISVRRLMPVLSTAVVRLAGPIFKVVPVPLSALHCGLIVDICNVRNGRSAKQVSSALSGALLIVVVVGRSVSLHRQHIKEWLARRANNPLP